MTTAAAKLSSCAWSTAHARRRSRLRAGAGRLTLQAVSPGTREFLRASVDYDNIPAADSVRFNLTVQRVRVQGASHVEDQEIFPNLSVDPADERYVASVLARSELAHLVGKVPAQRPDRTLDPGGLASAYVSSNADGDDGAPLSDYDLIGSQIDRTGLFALDRTDYFNLLCIPPLSREHDVGPSTLLVAARYCQQRRALLIVDPPAAWHTADDALRGLRDWDFASENALMYFPRILAHDKLRGHFESFAPCGAVAGMLARSDEASPMWGPGEARRGGPAPGLSTGLPGRRRSPQAARPPRRQYAAGGPLGHAYRRQGAHAGGRLRRRRRVAKPRGKAPGALHPQQHRARHSLGDRDAGARAGCRDDHGAGAELLRCSSTRRAHSPAAAWRKPSS